MSAIRMLFIFMAAFISLGIWLTGYNQVHWLLYIPPAALLFAGVTGICLGSAYLGALLATKGKKPFIKEIQQFVKLVAQAQNRKSPARRPGK